MGVCKPVDELVVELFTSSGWVDITSDVMQTAPLEITRGRPDEAARTDPSTLNLLLNNRQGKFSPRNPASPLHGELNKNTRIRVRLGPLPEAPSPFLVDTFDRTETDGWGTADTGQVWEDLFNQGAAAHSVLDGQGHIVLGVVDDSRNMITSTNQPADFDATFQVAMDKMPQGSIPGGVFWSLTYRRDGDGLDTPNYRANIAFRVPTGRVGGRTRITTNFTLYRDLGDITDLTPALTVPDLAYAPGEVLNVRVVAHGPDHRLKVWPKGQDEPDAWHSQMFDETLLGPGRVGFRYYNSPGTYATDFPNTVSVSDLVMSPPVASSDNVRFEGEVSEWPVTWDTSDCDAWVSLRASGIKRRLGQGSSPLASALRRAIPSFLPVAYWPMEDGPDTRLAESAVEGVNPLPVTGMRFADDDTLVSSGPLPTVGEGFTRILSRSLRSDPAAITWTATYVFNMDQPDPTPAGEHVMLNVVTSTGSHQVSMRNEGGDPVLQYRAFDTQGTQWSANWMHMSGVFPAFFGGWRRLELVVEQVAEFTARWEVRWYDTEGNWRFMTDTYTGEAGMVTRIATTFGSGMQGMSLGHLSVWGGLFPVAYNEAFSGYAGESTYQRLERLSAETGVPVQIQGDASTLLGPQRAGTFAQTLDEATLPDLGVDGERRDGSGLLYRARTTLYNQEPVVVLDYEAGTISPGIETNDDDQFLRNDVTVERVDGGRVRVVDDDGPLGVQTVGRYDESVSLNLADDVQLPGQAGWRLHLGTNGDVRFPSIRLDLLHPNVSPYEEALKSLDTGDRVRITNPPVWVGPDDIDVLVQGYTETIETGVWDLELVCTPASAWDVAVVEGDVDTRADTSGCVLNSAVSGSDTHLVALTDLGLFTPGNAVWVRDEGLGPVYPSDFPFGVRVGGEPMQVTGAQSVNWDDFDRFVASTWGTSDAGVDWIELGGLAQDRWTQDDAGHVELSSPSSTQRLQIAATDLTVFEVGAGFSIDQMATGGTTAPSIIARRSSDGNEYVLVRAHHTVAGNVFVSVWTTLEGQLAGDFIGQYTPGTVSHLRARFSNGRIQVKGWLDDEQEPFTWLLDVETGLNGGGGLGCSLFSFSANTNTNLVHSVHYFDIVNPQRLDVSRELGLDHPAGTPVSLARPSIVSL